MVFFDSIFRLTLGLACIGFTLSPSLSSRKAHLILSLRRMLSVRQCRSTPRELQAPTRPQHSQTPLHPRNSLVLHLSIPYSKLFRCRTSSAHPTVCSLWMSKERHSSGRPRCTTFRHEGHVCSCVRRAKVLADADRLQPGGKANRRWECCVYSMYIWCQICVMISFMSDSAFENSMYRSDLLFRFCFADCADVCRP